MPGFATLLLTVSLGQVIAQAQDERDAQLARCASMPDDSARLACFDAYARGPAKQDAAAPETPEEVAEKPHPERPEALIEVHSAGAERIPDQPEATRPDNSVKRVSAAPGQSDADVQVARIETFVRLKRSNRIRITLDNGQVWQENDGAPFRGNLEPGMEVTITKGRFGGYKMTVPTRSAAIFVRRLK